MNGYLVKLVNFGKRVLMSGIGYCGCKEFFILIICVWMKLFVS